jgi:hypothetical protein
MRVVPGWKWKSSKQKEGELVSGSGLGRPQISNRLGRGNSHVRKGIGGLGVNGYGLGIRDALQEWRTGLQPCYW